MKVTENFDWFDPSHVQELRSRYVRSTRRTEQSSRGIHIIVGWSTLCMHVVVDLWCLHESLNTSYGVRGLLYVPSRRRYGVHRPAYTEIFRPLSGSNSRAKKATPRENLARRAATPGESICKQCQSSHWIEFWLW